MALDEGLVHYFPFEDDLHDAIGDAVWIDQGLIAREGGKAKFDDGRKKLIDRSGTLAHGNASFSWVFKIHPVSGDEQWNDHNFLICYDSNENLQNGEYDSTELTAWIEGYDGDESPTEYSVHLWFPNGDDAYVEESTNRLLVDQDNLVVFVGDHTTGQVGVSVNGNNLVMSSPGSGFLDAIAQYIEIGGSYAEYAQIPTILMGDVAKYASVLDNTAIAAIWNGGDMLPLSGYPATPAYSWKMDEEEGTRQATHGGLHLPEKYRVTFGTSPLGQSAQFLQQHSRLRIPSGELFTPGITGAFTFAARFAFQDYDIPPEANYGGFTIFAKAAVDSATIGEWYLAQGSEGNPIFGLLMCNSAFPEFASPYAVGDNTNEAVADEACAIVVWYDPTANDGDGLTYMKWTHGDGVPVTIPAWPNNPLRVEREGVDFWCGGKWISSPMPGWLSGLAVWDRVLTEEEAEDYIEGWTPEPGGEEPGPSFLYPAMLSITGCGYASPVEHNVNL